MNLQYSLDLHCDWFQKKKGDVNRMTTQIEVRGHKRFDNVSRNGVNRN